MNNNYVPNITSIPNILFDYWMNVLSPAEFKVLMCISRKTYGWGKTSDSISVSQLEKMTGLSGRGIIKNIQVLMDYGLVTKIESQTADGDAAPNQYEINISCEKMGGSELSSVGSELSSGGVVNSVQTQNTYIPIKESKHIHSINHNTPPTPKTQKNSKPPASASESGSLKLLKKHGDFVELTEDDYHKLKALSPSLDQVIEEMNDWIGAKGKNPYKSFYHALKQWIRKRKESGNMPQTPKVDRRTKDRYGKPIEDAFKDGLF